VILGFLLSQLFAMNAAATEGAPPRRIDAQKPIRKHRTVTPCPGGALKRGALKKISFFFNSHGSGMNSSFMPVSTEYFF
jgi:hypothetical protein